MNNPSAARAAYHERRRNATTCRRGHVYNPKTVHIRPDGSRRCKICKSMSARLHHRTHRRIQFEFRNRWSDLLDWARARKDEQLINKMNCLAVGIKV